MAMVGGCMVMVGGCMAMVGGCMAVVGECMVMVGGCIVDKVEAVLTNLKVGARFTRQTRFGFCGLGSISMSSIEGILH